MTLPLYSLIILLGAAAGPARAAEPDDDSHWTVFTPPPPTTPSEPPPTTPEGGFSNPDRVRFDEKLRDRVLDQLCRHLKIKKDFNLFDGQLNGTSFGLSRYLATETGGRLALVDEERLRLNWGYPYSRALSEGGPSVGLWVGAGVAGKSMVIRRLDSTKTCSEVDRLANLTDIKTVIPFKAERISEMAVGELWRIPLTVNAGWGASLSEALGDASAVSLSFGYSKNGAASMTIYRLKDDTTRVRFRIDYVTVRSRALGVHKVIPAVEFASAGANILAELVDKEIAKQLRRYTSASLGISRAKSDGKRLLLEYTADPRDPAQAEALAEALKGNFRQLLRLARRVGTSFTSEEETLAAFEEFENDNSLQLGAPDYAALGEYRNQTKSFHMNLPFFFSRNVSQLFGSDKITRYTGEAGKFEFYSADRSPGIEFFNAPFLGPLVKDNEQRHLDAVTYAPAGQPTGEPIAVYIHNQGYLRMPGSAVAGTVEDANAILRLAGARRGAGGRPMELPAASFVPPPTLTGGQGPNGSPQENSDRKGWISFTLVMNQKALREALSASSAEVLRAFAAAAPLTDRTMAEWLAANGRLEDGKLKYDTDQAKRDLDIKDGDNSASWLYQMSLKAAGLVADYAEAAGASKPEDRAAAVAKAFSMKNRSGLEHHEVLKVLVQFMDPLDLTGDFVATVKSSTDKKGDLNAHYILKKDRKEVPLLSEAGETRGRFAEPSILTD